MRATLLKTKRFWIIALFVVVLLGTLAWLATRSDVPALDVALPSPNGYDDFLAAEAQLPERLPDTSKATKEELARLLTEHAPALARTRQGLAKECRVPLDYSPSAITNLGQHAGPAKNLGFLFRDAGRLAELNSNYTQAAQCYLDGLRYSAKRFHGGLLIDQLVGYAVTKVGGAQLQRLIPKLNTEECRAAIAVLLEIDTAEEPANIIQQRDQQWSLKVMHFSKIQAFLYRFHPQIKKVHIAKLHERTRFRRGLMVDLAKRAFQAETGNAPENIEGLIPQYLPEVPKDPATGAPMTL